MVSWDQNTPAGNETAWVNVHVEVSLTPLAAVTQYYKVDGPNNEHVFLIALKA